MQHIMTDNKGQEDSRHHEKEQSSCYSFDCHKERGKKKKE